MVRESPLWVLSKSCTPKSASSKLICFKTAVGVIYACSAALLKLPASATRINVSSCGLYIVSLPFLRFSYNISDYLFHNNMPFAEKAIKLLLLGNISFFIFLFIQIDVFVHLEMLALDTPYSAVILL